MTQEITNNLTNLIKEELSQNLSDKLKNVNVIELRDFKKETGIYINADFIAGYLFYKGKDYVLLEENTFPYLSESRQKSILFHEFMHLISTKKNDKDSDVGFVFRKINFVNINEGLNEIAAGYFFEKAYKDLKYYYVKAYNLYRKICEYLISYIYKDIKEFFIDYINESPYSFYKKIFYTFKINNLLELKKIMDYIVYEVKRCNKSPNDLIKEKFQLRVQE